MDIGFTGTRKGMSEAQFNELASLILTFLKEGGCRFHHGQCVGSDCEAAQLAYELGCFVIAHPGYLAKNPQWMGSRGPFANNSVILPEKPFLVRDHDIVDASEVLLATPAQKDEVLRSGTWATIRYGCKTKTVVIIFPDGTTEIRGNKCL